MNEIEVKMNQKQFRITRNKPYPPNTPGFDDVSARQGHYVTAENQLEALKKMRIIFPDKDETFVVQDW